MRLIRRIGPWVAALACFVAAITVVPTAWGPVVIIAAALLVSFALLDGSHASQVADDEFPSSAWRLRRDADGIVLEQIALAAYFDRSLIRHRLLRLLTGTLVYLPMLALVGVLALAMAMPGFSPGIGAALAILAVGAFMLVPVVMFHRRGRSPAWFRMRLRDARLELNGAAAGWARPRFVRQLDATQLQRISVVHAKVTIGPTLRLPCLVLHLADGAALQLPPMPSNAADLAAVGAAATLIGGHLCLPPDRIGLPAGQSQVAR